MVIRILGALLTLFLVDCWERENRGIESDMAALSDSLALRTQLACDRQKMRLNCPTHTKIAIETVFYGRSLPSSELCGSSSVGAAATKRRVAAVGFDAKDDDESGGSRLKLASAISWLDADRFEDTNCELPKAYTRIVEKCQNKEECIFKVGPTFFGRDPCPETSKYLRLNYRCKPSQFISESYCENSTVDLMCLDGQYIAIYSAIYGRSVADSDFAGCTDKEFILNDCHTNAFRWVFLKCHARQSCSFTATNEELLIDQNPCPRSISKHLNLVYMCVERSVFDESYIRSLSLDFVASTSYPDEDVAAFSMNDDERKIEASQTNSRQSKKSISTMMANFYNETQEESSKHYQNCLAADAKLISCIERYRRDVVLFIYGWLLLKDYVIKKRDKIVVCLGIFWTLSLVLTIVYCVIDRLVSRRRAIRSGCDNQPHQDGTYYERNTRNPSNLNNGHAIPNHGNSSTSRQPIIRTMRQRDFSDYRRADDHEEFTIDYMAVGLPFGARALLEDEYYV